MSLAVKILAMIGVVALFVLFGDFLYKLITEAQKKDKNIEFGMFIVAALSVVIAVVALGFTVHNSEKTDKRITELKTQIDKLNITPTIIPTTKP